MVRKNETIQGQASEKFLRIKCMRISETFPGCKKLQNR